MLISWRHRLKWKPPSENSIDFKLVLRFPPAKTSGKRLEPDFHARPIFALQVWAGGANYEPYDTMHVTDEEWEQMKASGEQFDERIVEVHWDAELESWRMMRFRDDKPNGNHKTIVENIISSIADGVEKDVVRALHVIGLFGPALTALVYLLTCSCSRARIRSATPGKRDTRPAPVRPRIPVPRRRARPHRHYSPLRARV